MSVMQPEGSLDAAHFVVVRLRPEDEPGDPELGIVPSRPPGHHTPEVGPEVTGVQGKLEVFLSPGFLSQLHGQELAPHDEVQFISFCVEFLEDPPPLDVPAGDVVGVVVVAVLVRTLPVPLPPLLHGLPLVRVHSDLLGHRVGLPVLPAGRHLQGRGGAQRGRRDCL